MSKFSLRCKVVEVGEVKQITESFKKAEVIGVIEGEYPEHYKFEFPQGKADLVDSILPDTYVTFHFNIGGRKVEKEGKDPMYFTSLNVWKVEAS